MSESGDPTANQPREDLSAFAKHLHAARIQRGLTLDEFSRRLPHDVARSKSTLYKWEAGHRPTNVRDVTAVEKVLGLKPGQLTRFLGYLQITDELDNATKLYQIMKSDPIRTLLIPATHP